MTPNYDHQMELFHISNVIGDTRYTVDFASSELQGYVIQVMIYLAQSNATKEYVHIQSADGDDILGTDFVYDHVCLSRTRVDTTPPISSASIRSEFDPFVFEADRPRDPGDPDDAACKNAPRHAPAHPFEHALFVPFEYKSTFVDVSSFDDAEAHNLLGGYHGASILRLQNRTRNESHDFLMDWSTGMANWQPRPATSTRPGYAHAVSMHCCVVAQTLASPLPPLLWLLSWLRLMVVLLPSTNVFFDCFRNLETS